MRMHRALIGFGVTMVVGAFARAYFIPVARAEGAPAYVQAALDNLGRPRTDKARDAAMKPVEAIVFAEVKPGDKVVDLLPGNAYYTRIFSYIVGSRGHVYALVPRILPA